MKDYISTLTAWVSKQALPVLSKIYETKYLILLLKISITLLAGAAICWIFMQLWKSGVGVKVKSSTEEALQSSKWFDWQKKVVQLKANGALFRSPELKNPLFYLTEHLLISSAVGAALCFITPFLFPVGFGMGWFILNRTFESSNKKDERQMLPDVIAIANALSLQMKGGEHIAEALASCREIVTTKRMKTALSEFNRHIVVNDITLLEALEDFGSKFKMAEIAAICTALKQGLETGETVRCTEDIAKLCLGSRESQFMALQSETETTVTIAVLILFAINLAFVLIQIISSISTQTTAIIK